ncbi:hypothetical protein HDU81_005416 [Chytriomyces hyalinus]|nr:hypothetical protein HDU81_005416 [Chytriomyces hyalinus]
MVDLLLLSNCRWYMRETTSQHAGKTMNCTSEEWSMSNCHFFSNGNTSLLHAYGASATTQALFDPPTKSFRNLTAIWSFNASEATLPDSSYLEAGGYNPIITRFGLFGFRHYNTSKWLLDDASAYNKSARVGFCIEDQEPYVSYKDIQGNTYWQPNLNATAFTYGIPSSSLV